MGLVKKQYFIKPGEVVLKSITTPRDIPSNMESKLATINSNITGAAKITIDLTTVGANQGGLRIYKNGVIYKEIYEVTGGFNKVYTVDFSFKPKEKIEMFLFTVQSTGTFRMNSFYIKANAFPFSIV